MNWFLLAFISALFSAASAVAEKKTLFSLDALKFSFIVSAVTLLFTLPFFGMVKYEEIISIRMLILFLKTILSSAAFLCVMLSMKNLLISEALPMLALTPGLVAIAGVIFINDSLTTLEWTGIFLMTAGTYIIELKKGTSSFWGPVKSLLSFSKYSYIFYALILFTVSSLLDRVLLKNYNLPPYTFMAFQQLFYVLIFGVIALAVEIFHRAKNKTDVKMVVKNGGVTKNTWYLIILISILTVVYRYTQIEATKLAPVALVLSVKRISVLFAVIFGGRLFNEDNLMPRVAAAAIIITGATILINW